MHIEEIELEPGFICEFGHLRPERKMILEYTPRTDFMDFGAILRGSINVEVKGAASSFTTRENSSSIIQGGRNLAVHELIPGADYRWVNIRLRTDFLEHCTGCSISAIQQQMDKINCCGNEPLYHYNRPLPPSINECIIRILESSPRSASEKLLIRAKCLEAVAYHLDDLGSSYEAVKTAATIDIKTRKAREILVNNYRTPPGVREIARAVGLNETYLKQAFKKRYDKTIHQYLLSCRMEHAAYFIKQHGLSVSEACYAVGYSSMSQFSSAFKKYHGSSPGKFRTTAAQE